MESGNYKMAGLNSLSQVSGHMCLETELPWLIADCGTLGLNNLKPVLQATHLLGIFERTTSKNSSPECCQLTSNESGAKFTQPASVTSPEQFKSINLKEGSKRYIDSANSAALFPEYKTAVSRDATSLPLKHNENVWNGNSQVHLVDSFQVHASEACQKRFIMFDQSGNRGRIIFHPASVQGFAEILPNIQQVKQDISVQNIGFEKKEILKIPNLVNCDAELSLYRQTMASAFAALQNMRMNHLGVMALDSHGGEFVACPVREEKSGDQLSSNGLIQANPGGSESQSHENTEDLEALLGSDEEESSTGHSPSEISRKYWKTYAEYSIDDSNDNLAKRCQQQGHEKEEVNFNPASDEESVGESGMNDKSFFDVPPIVTASWELGIRPKNCENVRNDECSDKIFPGLSAVSILRETSTKRCAPKCRKTHKSFTGQSTSAKKSRKGRIKSTVKLLRSMISGGDSMDTAVVLNETIQYIKSLQAKLKRLEANWHEQLM